MDKLSRSEKLRSALQIVIGGHLFAFGVATYKGDERWYRRCIMPLVQLLNPEQAHNFAVKTAKWGLVPKSTYTDPPSLKTQLWGKQFKNPIGLAAGFDKQGEAVDGMLKTGFGFVEVGTVTPEPQEGNPKPRIFRLSQDQAVINRYGFNSHGHDQVLQRLENRLQEKQKPGIVGVNLGKNKLSKDDIGDYVKGVEKFGPVSDYLVINISSPNTPGLRAMQGRHILQGLVSKVTEARNKLDRTEKPPILIKLAPDLSEQDKKDIAAVVCQPNSGVDGLIVSNTTTSRPSTLQSRDKHEQGGLSGEPLKTMATETIRDMYRLTQGRVPIIGVGGVSSGKDALDKIKAGASLVQLYTALAYEGPPLVTRIKRELAELLQKEDVTRISEIVGKDS